MSAIQETTGQTTPRTRSQSQLRRPLVWRGFAVLVAAVTLLIGLGATGANASVSWYGSTTSGLAWSSTISHTFTVGVSVMPMTGYSTQTVSYRVAVRDVTYSTNSPFTYHPWSGQYTYNFVIPPTNCNELTMTGCVPITVPRELPSTSFRGVAGHRYDVWVQTAFKVGSTWSYAPFTRINYCAVYYSTNGSRVNATFCRT